MTFRDGFEGVFFGVLTSASVLSTTVLAVILYAFFYPAPYAHQTPQGLPVVVVDAEHSSVTREILRDLAATRAIAIVAEVPDIRAAEAIVRGRRADGILLFSQGLTRRLLTGAGAGGVGVWLNGTYLLRASEIGEAVGSAVAGVAVRRIDPATRALGLSAPTRVEVQPLFNTTAGYRDYVFPAVAVVILQQTLLFGISTLIAERRERGRWRMTSSEFLGSWVAASLIGVLAALLYFGLFFWMQNVPRGGNIRALILIAPLFAGWVAALALLFGSLFDKGARAMMVLVPTSVPLFFLTGAAWPVGQMPVWIRLVAWLSPSTAGVHVFVPLNQMAASLGDVLPSAMVLALGLVVTGGAAWLRFISTE